MLGIREPGVYGRRTYEELTAFIESAAARIGVSAEIFQSNHEGAIVDKIQSALGRADAIVINPAAYTHTSVAILDALKAVALPSAEVHLSDVRERESFRQLSYAGMACARSFIGLGFDGYARAIEYLKESIENHNT
jgi:3-dehydroquinate dehydratase-2